MYKNKNKKEINYKIHVMKLSSRYYYKKGSKVEVRSPVLSMYFNEDYKNLLFILINTSKKNDLLERVV